MPNLQKVGKREWGMDKKELGDEVKERKELTSN